PYLIFQLIYTGYYYLLGKSNFQNDLFDPQWSLWFLLSLFFWHLLLILFKKIPAFLSISIAIIIGLLIGYIDDVGSAFSLLKTFCFLKETNNADNNVIYRHHHVCAHLYTT